MHVGSLREVLNPVRAIIVSSKFLCSRDDLLNENLDVSQAQVEFGLFVIEHNGHENRLRDIKGVLETAGFVNVKQDYQDVYYANPRYFSQRGLKMPPARR